MQEQDLQIDEAYYPVTDKVDWGPLHKALVGDWMFMEATTSGLFYYKHKITRELLVIDGDGEIVGRR
jgi:hypothetical protein